MPFEPDILPGPPAPSVANECALFLDIDGTLLDFDDDPASVACPPSLLSDLHQIHDFLGGAVAFLSGRPLAQIDVLFNWNTRVAAGLHGAQLRTADLNVVTGSDLEGLTNVRIKANTLIKEFGDVRLEDKTHALALHYRGAPDAQEVAEHIAEALLQLAGSGYELQRGDCVIEIKPAGADKGKALQEIMKTRPFRNRTPWMLGDDLTDENAFRAANALGGTSIIVGRRRPTAAINSLPDPAAAREWLHAFAQSKHNS